MEERKRKRGKKKEASTPSLADRQKGKVSWGCTIEGAPVPL
jgi:hypothetical protein